MGRVSFVPPASISSCLNRHWPSPEASSRVVRTRECHRSVTGAEAAVTLGDVESGIASDWPGWPVAPPVSQRSFTGRHIGGTNPQLKAVGTRSYATGERRYATLAQIASFICTGGDVQVLDKDTDQYLTAATIAQILFEETKQEQPLPSPGLRRIIVSGVPVE